jgi:predicted short-subunit dehydrogenase-like oxidoreductase (DUF2520 family)
VSDKKSRGVRKPTVSIVGAGRLGTALALALTQSGYKILAMVSRRSVRARTAAALINSNTLTLNSKQLRELPPSDLILITTPDDAIESTARELSTSVRWTAGATVLHTSGALSSLILSPLAQAGFHTGSIHPLVSVSDPHSGAESLHGAFYCVEGDRTAVAVARAITRDLGGKSFSIAPEKKALYHAAAVMSSGHITALFDIAIEMLTSLGLSQREAQRVLLPLVRSTVSNLEGSDTAHALTGTFARGDIATAEAHVEALNYARLQQARAAYKLLGARSLEIAARRHVEPAVLSKLRQALDEIDE